MNAELSSISRNLVKDLCHFYVHLKSKNHPAIKAQPNNDKPTIIVIGAGLAGLTAAKALTEHGLNVILIEARDRVGGRIQSIQLENGEYIELGAQFFHGVKNNPLYNLSEQYHVDAKPYIRSDWAIYDLNGNEINKSQLNEMVDEYQEQLNALALNRHSDDKDRFTVDDLEYIDQQLLKHKAIESRDLRSLAKMISIKQLKKEKLFSYKLGLLKKESESNYLVTNGYSKLTEGMHTEAQQTGLMKTFLSEEVVKIDHINDEVIVHTRKGNAYHADAAICTLPLGVLQQGKIVFEPSLPAAKIKAINMLKCATHNKVILQFEEAFWDNYSHFVVLYDQTLQAWLDIINLQYFSQHKAPLLISSVYSNSDQPLPDDKQLVEHCVELFKRIYPSKFMPLKNSWVTHWDTDPYALGSYSYHPDDSNLDDNSAIAKPVGRLLFAGEHTHRSPANLQAAYLSGLESAKQVVDQLLFIYECSSKE